MSDILKTVWLLILAPPFVSQKVEKELFVAWIPAFLLRSYSFEGQVAGMTIGMIIGVF